MPRITTNTTTYPSFRMGVGIQLYPNFPGNSRNDYTGITEGAEGVAERDQPPSFGLSGARECLHALNESRSISM